MEEIKRDKELIDILLDIMIESGSKRTLYFKKSLDLSEKISKYAMNMELKYEDKFVQGAKLIDDLEEQLEKLFNEDKE